MGLGARVQKEVLHFQCVTVSTGLKTKGTPKQTRADSEDERQNRMGKPEQRAKVAGLDTSLSFAVAKHFPTMGLSSVYGKLEGWI